MSESTETEATSFRMRPQHWVLALGIGVALFTAGSGIAAAIFDQKGDSEIHRTVFGNIPTAAKVVFYTILPIIIIWGGVGVLEAGEELGGELARRGINEPRAKLGELAAHFRLDIIAEKRAALGLAQGDLGPALGEGKGRDQTRWAGAHHDDVDHRFAKGQDLCGFGHEVPWCLVE